MKTALQRAERPRNFEIELLPAERSLGDRAVRDLEVAREAIKAGMPEAAAICLRAARNTVPDVRSQVLQRAIRDEIANVISVFAEAGFSPLGRGLDREVA